MTTLWADGGPVSPIGFGLAALDVRADAAALDVLREPPEAYGERRSEMAWT